MPGRQRAREDAGDGGPLRQLDERQVVALAVAQPRLEAGEPHARHRGHVRKALGRQRRAGQGLLGHRRLDGMAVSWPSGRAPPVPRSRRAASMGVPSRLKRSILASLRTLLEQRRHDLLRHLLANLLLLLLEGRNVLALVQHLDHVPAELGLHGVLADGADRDLEGGVGELLHHRALGEIAEIAAVLLGARVDRLLLGERGEVRTLAQIGDDRLGLFLGLRAGCARHAPPGRRSRAATSSRHRPGAAAASVEPSLTAISMTCWRSTWRRAWASASCTSGRFSMSSLSACCSSRWESITRASSGS